MTSRIAGAAALGLVLALPVPAHAQKLACQTGTEDRHARIAMEIQKNRVKQFAYYSKWKPKTCSIAAARGDAYTKWSDKGNVTTVAMAKGTAVIEHAKNEYRFTFKNVDREFYCGLEGEINGTVTLHKGRAECELEGVMDEPLAAAEAKEGESKP